MKNLSSDEQRRLAETLNMSSNRYYVYALCKNEKIPFYIGKGCGDRVFAHLSSAEMARELIEGDDTLSDEAKETKIAEQTKKIQTILDAGDSFEMVVVKWGLTEHEAFMCESALINMLKFSHGCVIPELTNVVNGHASKAEKASVADVKTKARTVSSFLDECAIPICNVDNVQENVAFIKINRLYRKCVDGGVADRDHVRECVRAVWPVGAGKRERIQYIFALYHARIVGVFHVTHVSRPIGQELESGLVDFPTFPPDVRLIDRMKARFATVSDAQQELTTEEFDRFVVSLEHKDREPDDVLSEFRRRIYFSADDNVPEHLRQYENCIVERTAKTSGMLSTQWPVTCNF